MTTELRELPELAALHGGFGFTWDCDAHLPYKRALASAATWGDGLHQRRALVADLRRAAGIAIEAAS